MIHTETVRFPVDGPAPFEGHLARQRQGRAPAIMILSEMFGLNAAMRELAAHYAERGFPVVVPDIYWRSAHPGALDYEGEERQKAWDRLAAFDFGAVGGDMRAVADWTRAQPWCSGKVVALGFCAGGKMAYLAAARSGVDGAISLYGLGIAAYLNEAPAIACPVQLHYGMEDKHIPLSEVEAVEAGVAANPRIRVIRYPGAGHSFFNPIRPGYHEPSARIAARHIDALLDEMA